MYNQVLDYIQQDDTQGLDDDDLFLFTGITAHQSPLTKDNPMYNGSSYNVMVEWVIEFWTFTFILFLQDVQSDNPMLIL